jgi:DNA polymerase III subunit alpha
MPNFVHLHLHTEYSIVDGLINIPSLLQTCVKSKMPAVAVTDRCNFFGLVKFYEAAIATGIKPIVGANVFIHNEQDERHPFLLTLLCQNQIGYKNLTQLISRAYLEGQYLGIPMVKYVWIEEAAEGLIALSGGREGDIGRALLADNEALVEQLVVHWQRCFPKRFYVELQRTGRVDEENYLQAALNLAAKHFLPIVATNDVRFLVRDDFEAHEARVCIHDGYIIDDAKRPRLYSEQQYLRSPEEMSELFADLPEALENTVLIAKRCNLELSLGKVYLPNFPVPKGITIEDYFTKEAQAGLPKKNIPLEQVAIYEERLNHEIKIINQMGFAGYFLIVADFINWARQHDIPVGPGRGSGPGSLVAYALGITDLDPINHDLLFERFLNPERVSMPDFDIDFCMEGRDRVINYVAEHYGHENVAQIITFGTMAAKAVVRDVGRALGLPYGYVDKIAKLIPFELGMTLEKALKQENRLENLYKTEEDVKTLMDLAFKLEGIIRNVGKHAGGLVIAPSALIDFAPLYCEENGENLVTQFDKNDVETVGLVKLDFLGLRTLTIINWAVQVINIDRKQKGQELLDIVKIPLDDKATYDLLKSGAMTGVFQIESRGMRDLAKRLRIDCFGDIVALVALFRPGPLQSGMVEDFIERKHGRSIISYFHPDLKVVLAPTYGVILYQEQVMQIAQILAGYSLGSADLLRRAMGKKKPEEMAKQRAVFIEGAAKRGVDKHLAHNIFDLMEKFAGYGFNKSHSVGYALITYQTAWLKAHYPAEFMAAVLSSDMDNTDKVALFVEECRLMKLPLIPPHINHSQYKFTVNNESKIIYGLGAIKGVGESAVENLVINRKKEGGFKNLFELCKRIDNRKINKRVLEALVSSGAMDGLGADRSSMFASIPIALKSAEQNARFGSRDLFADLATEEDDEMKSMYVKMPPWDEVKRLLLEHETLGVYLSGHPIEHYENELAKFTKAKIAELNPSRNKTVRIAGFIAALKILRTKNDKPMAIVTLEDRSGRIDVTIFSEVYDTVRENLVKDRLLIIEGEVSVDNFSGNYRVEAKKALSMQQAREIYAKCLQLKIDERQESQLNKTLAELNTVLKPYCKGKCSIVVSYFCNDACCELVLGDEWRVCPTDDLLKKLQSFVGETNVEFVYAHMNLV